VSHPLREQIASADPQQRAGACRDAAGDPSAVLLIDALGEALGDPDANVARAASEALAEIGARAGEVDAVLRRALHSDRPNARWAAAFASARLAPPGPGLLPALVEALACGAGDVRWRAARLLVENSPVLAEVRPLLLGLAGSDPRPEVRQMAVHCLRELADDDPEAARVLMAATRDRDVRVRRAGLSALAALGDPPAAIPERLLEAASDDADPPSRRIAEAALRILAGAPARRTP
jgi:HEAT repeat protein